MAPNQAQILQLFSSQVQNKDRIICSRRLSPSHFCIMLRSPVLPLTTIESPPLLFLMLPQVSVPLLRKSPLPPYFKFKPGYVIVAGPLPAVTHRAGMKRERKGIRYKDGSLCFSFFSCHGLKHRSEVKAS